MLEPPGLRGRAYALDEEITLGRAAGCQVPLEDAYASQVHARVFQRDGMLLTESEFNPLRNGEKAEERTVRCRTVGDLTLTGCVESDADTIDKIIDEIAIARVTERGATRGDDRFSEAAMEDRKKEGYF